jgi:hypothetical protein
MLQGAATVNCDDYLSMLATLPVEELAYGSARAHAAGCRDCDRVTRVVAERERNMLVAFDNLYSSVPAVQAAAGAVTAARRRRIGLYYKIGLAFAAVAILFYMALSRTVIVSPASSLVSETFRLQCLSPEQAAEMLRPLIGATGRISIRSNSPLGIIKVEVARRDGESALGAGPLRQPSAIAVRGEVTPERAGRCRNRSRADDGCVRQHPSHRI